MARALGDKSLDFQRGASAPKSLDAEGIEPNLSMPDDTSASPEPTSSNPKRILAIVFLLAIPLAFLLVGGIIFWNPVLRVVVNPANATVRIDGKISGKKQRLKPGKHIVSISAPGFVKYEQRFHFRPVSFPKIKLELRPLPTPQFVVSKSAYGLASDQNSQQFFWIGEDRKVIFRAIVENNSIKEKRAITPNNLPAVKKVIFSPDFRVAVLKLVNGQTGLYDFKRYDMVHQEYTPWGDDIGDATWSPDGKTIIYQQTSSQTHDNALFRSTRDHDNPTRFFDLRDFGIKSPQLSWSADSYLLSLVDQGNLYILDLQSNILTKAISGGVESARFAPDSNHILFTQNSVVKWLDYERSSGLDANVKNSQIGRIKLSKIYNLNLEGDAKKAYFDQKEGRIILLSKDSRIFVYDFIRQTLRQFQINFPKTPPKIVSVGLSADSSLLYLLTESGDLLSVRADSGEY